MMQLDHAVGTDLLRGRLQELIRHPGGLAQVAPAHEAASAAGLPHRAKPALIEVHNKVNTAIGPGFLGDKREQRASPGAKWVHEDALPGNGEVAPPFEVPPPLPGSAGLAVAPVAVVQAGSATPAEPVQHSLVVLDKGEARAAEPVSERLDHALADASHMMSLFTAGVEEGTEAAMDNVMPTGWEVAVGAARAPPPPTGLPAVRPRSASAMAFFKGAEKLGDAPQRPQRRAATLLELAARSAVETATKARSVTEHVDVADALGPTTVDVLPAKRQASANEEAQRALLLAAQQRQAQSLEAARAADLESQRRSEEDMVSTMQMSSWGI